MEVMFNPKQNLNIILPNEEITIEPDKIITLDRRVIKLSKDVIGVLKITLTNGSVLVFHALLNYEINNVEPEQSMEAMFRSIRTSSLFVADGSI